MPQPREHRLPRLSISPRTLASVDVAAAVDSGGVDLGIALAAEPGPEWAEE